MGLKNALLDIGGSGTTSCGDGFNYGYPSGYHARSGSFSFSWPVPRKIVSITGVSAHANAGETSSRAYWYLYIGGNTVDGADTGTGTNVSTKYASASYSGTWTSITSVSGSGYAQGNTDVSNGAYNVSVSGVWYNYPTWTDDPVVADNTKIRKIHIDELRTEINVIIADRGGVQRTWTDPTITADSTKIRSVHITEVRSACEYAATLPNIIPAPVWTDNSLVSGTTKVRATHINEIRRYIESLADAG